MSEGILSQAEIDALLKGNDELSSDEDLSIDSMEKDTLGEIANISMGTAATTLSSLLGKKVEITTPNVELTSKEKLRKDYPRPYVVIDVQYTQGLKGNNLLVISTKDASIIADLMMGGTGENPPQELNELHMSAVSEAMNQMMGSASTSMSTVLDKRIDISPPFLDLIDFNEQDLGLKDVNQEDSIIKISFRLVIQGLIKSEIMQLMPLDFAKGISKELLANLNTSSFSPEIISDSSDTYLNEPIPEEYPEFISPPEEQKEILTPIANKAIPIKTVEFTQLNSQSTEGKPQNLDLILDVPLQVSVELGRTNKSIREILDFSTGSIIELNKLAGEPVDMLINGKLFAKGEVVVIDENFGVRITDIISPLERVKNLQ